MFLILVLLCVAHITTAGILFSMLTETVLDVYTKHSCVTSQFVVTMAILTQTLVVNFTFLALDFPAIQITQGTYF